MICPECGGKMEPSFASELLDNEDQIIWECEDCYYTEIRYINGKKVEQNESQD